MNSRIKVALLVICLLTVGLIVFRTYKVTAHNGPAAFVLAQNQTRIVVTKTHLNPPVKITGLKTKKGTLERDKEFLDDDDWLTGLTIRLANRSGKSVTFISIELVFLRTQDQKAGIDGTWPLRKGTDPFLVEGVSLPELPQVELAAPGDDFEIVLSDVQYGQIKSFLSEIQFRDSVKKVEIQVVKIGFSDGTAWNGRMYRRDPTNTNGPLKGWRAIEDVGWKKPRREPLGSAQNRTALFPDAGTYRSGRHWRMFQTAWSASSSTSVAGTTNFQTRAKVNDVNDAQLGRWACDVFLTLH